MRTYPVELCLEGRRVVVIGGGSVAARKVHGLLAAGAAVTVVSPKFGPELSGLTGIERQEQPYTPGALDGAAAVFACTDDPATNARVAADALAAGLLCNVVDNREQSSFLVPAVLRQGDLTIAVGTGGASPLLAAAVRDELASRYGPLYANWTEELAAARGEVLLRTANAGLRRRILETLCTADSLNLLVQQGRPAWREWVQRVVEQGLCGREMDPPAQGSR